MKGDGKLKRDNRKLMLLKQGKGRKLKKRGEKMRKES